MDKDALINGFFENSLSEKEQETFRHLLQSDSEFKAEVAFQNELRVALKKEDRKSIKHMFSQLKDEGREQDTKVIPLRRFAAAASIILILGLGSWIFFFNNPSFSPDQLYDANFTPYENVLYPIERGNQIEDLKTKAFVAYENGEYQKALNLLQEIDNNIKDPYLDFYSANILMQLDRHHEAIPLLENYINQNGELKDRALWYMALAHLKLKQPDKSMALLEQLVNLGSFKRNAAEKLIQDLK